MSFTLGVTTAAGGVGGGCSASYDGYIGSYAVTGAL